MIVWAQSYWFYTRTFSMSIRTNWLIMYYEFWIICFQSTAQFFLLPNYTYLKLCIRDLLTILIGLLFKILSFATFFSFFFSNKLFLILSLGNFHLFIYSKTHRAWKLGCILLDICKVNFFLYCSLEDSVICENGLSWH